VPAHVCVCVICSCSPSQQPDVQQGRPGDAPAAVVCVSVGVRALICVVSYLYVHTGQLPMFMFICVYA